MCVEVDVLKSVKIDREIAQSILDHYGGDDLSSNEREEISLCIYKYVEEEDEGIHYEFDVVVETSLEYDLNYYVLRTFMANHEAVAFIDELIERYGINED